MFWFVILVPATAMVAGGYLVLVHSHQTVEGLKTFGKYLAYWIFALAGLYVVGSTTALIFGHGHGRGMHGRGTGGEGMMGGGMMGGGMMGGRGGMGPATGDQAPHHPTPEPEAPANK